MLKNRSSFSPRAIGNFFKKFYIYIVLIVIYVPLIVIVILSFAGQTQRGNVNFNFGAPTAVNYLKLFQNDSFINALLNTLLLSVVVLPISLIIAIVTCFGMWKAKPFQRKTVDFATKLTIVNPEAITGISLALLFSST
jgi:spermidine/putrescine transport system permease protein